MDHLLFECPHVSALGSSIAVTLLRDDLVWARSSSKHAKPAFPSGHVPAVADAACLVLSSSTLLLAVIPIGACGCTVWLLSRRSCMPYQWYVICGVHPPAPVRVSVVEPTAWSSVHSWVPRLHSGSVLAPHLLLLCLRLLLFCPRLTLSVRLLYATPAWVRRDVPSVSVLRLKTRVFLGCGVGLRLISPITAHGL